MVHEKIANVKVRRFSLIKFRFGRIKGVKFQQTKRIRWNDYEAY